jgi:hypothetical protein
MCKEADRPHRRHRPMYLAPTARPILHPPLIVPDMRDPWLPRGAMEQEQQEQHQQQPLQVPLGGLFPLAAPTRQPSRGFALSQHDDSDSNNFSGQRSFGAAIGGTRRWKDILNAIWSCYHWLEDALLLVLVCLMGCFFYDVEVKVVKTDRQRRSHLMRLGVGGDVVRSGRVIIRTDSDDRQQHRLPLHHHTNHGSRSTTANNGPSRLQTEESRPQIPHDDANHESRSWGPSTGRRSQLYQPTPWHV